MSRTKNVIPSDGGCSIRNEEELEEYDDAKFDAVSVGRAKTGGPPAKGKRANQHTKKRDRERAEAEALQRGEEPEAVAAAAAAVGGGGGVGGAPVSRRRVDGSAERAAEKEPAAKAARKSTAAAGLARFRRRRMTSNPWSSCRESRPPP